MYSNIRNISGQIYQLTFILLFYVLIYMFMFLMYCDLHASFHSARIFEVCNSVIWPTHSKFDYGHIVLNYTAILCTIHWTRMLIDIGYWTLNIYYYYYYCVKIASTDWNIFISSISLYHIMQLIEQSNTHNQATRSKVTGIIVHKFIKPEQRRKYWAICNLFSPHNSQIH